MSESFVSSGENSDIVSGPPPQLQGLSLPGIDNPQFVDGFGIVTPWGGGGTTRRYADYGITTDRQTQLNDLASAFIPAEGGGISFGLDGQQGIQGIPGPQGLPGIITILGLNLPTNSSFLTELPHNIDQINDLGTVANKLIYTSESTTFYDFVWVQTNIDAAVKSWNDSDINADGSFFIIAADDGIYISTDDGDNWTKYNPDADTYLQASCAASTGGAMVLGDTERANGTLWTTVDYGVNWVERTVSAEDPS